MIEKFNDLQLQPSKANELTLQLIENGKIIQEEKTHNFIGKQQKLNAEFLYKCLPFQSNSGIYLSSIGVSSAALYLYNDTSTFEDEMYANNASMGVTGYCDRFSTSVSNTQQGIYLPSAFKGGVGSLTYCWEWATTQANGLIKSLGFVPSSGCTFTQAGSVPYAISIPQFQVAKQKYIGFETVGADKILYFRNCESIADNIVTVKESDYSLVKNKSLDLTAATCGGVQNNSYTSDWSDTVFVNGHFYTLQSGINAGNIPFRKALKADGVFGDVINIPYTYGTPINYWGSVNSMASDERYIYITAYCIDYTYARGSQHVNQLITIDTQTDTVTSVVANPIGAQTNGKICADIFNTDVLYMIAGNTTVYRYTKSTNKVHVIAWHNMNSSYGFDLVYSKGDKILVKGTSYYVANFNPLVSPPDVTDTVFAVYSRSSNIMSYAELPNPITKTSSQSLRVQYTMQLF